MAINVSQAFHRTSANPVDESMALTKAEMLAVNDNLMPSYYFTICQDDGYIYLYDKSATASVTTGKFTKFEGSGGGGGSTGGLVITKTLAAASWDANNRQSLTFTDYDADMGGVIGMPTNATATQKEAYSNAVIDVYSQSGNVFTFQCETVPSVDLPVTLYAGGSGGSGSGVPAGGTTGQALVKKSSTDGDVEWKDVDNSVFEIHFANDAVDVTYSQLGEALSANKILKLIDTVNDVVLAFTGYYSGAYYFSTICLNRRQEMVNTSIILYHQAVGSDVVATQVQRLTLTEDVQKMEMPTADSSYLNKIYQYIGTTDANFTYGLFYKCVINGSQYAWEQCDVQSYPEADLTNVFASGFPVASVSGARQFEYSTGEQIVGTWIDGKPIYQRTWTGLDVYTAYNSWTNIVRIPNIALIIDVKAYGLDSTDHSLLPAALEFAVQSTDYIATEANTSINLRVIKMITVQYTKTTD